MSGPCNWPCWKWRIRDPSSTCVCPLDSYGWVIRTFCAGMNISNWVDWTTKMTRWNSPISPSPSSIWTRMWRWRCENDDSKRQNKNNNFPVMNRGHFFFTCINCRSWAGRLWAGRPSALPVSWRSGDAGALARWASRTEGAPAPSPSRSFHRFKRSPNIIRLNNNNGQQLDGRNLFFWCPPPSNLVTIIF